MKKKILTILLVLLPLISIILVVVYRLTAEPSNIEVIDSLKNIQMYKADVEYIIKNSRGVERETTTHYYSTQYGRRIDFGEDRSKIYLDDKIIVKDNISEKTYEVEEEVDVFHSIAFLDILLLSPITSNEIKVGKEEWGETEYIEIDCDLLLSNDHLDSVKIFIDKNSKTPIGAIVYDKESIEKVRIVYKNFEKLKEIEEGLFS